MTDIVLPRKDENGEYYLSYSQISSWMSTKSFNLGINGKLEYMAAYFLKRNWPDQGWALFGQDVEDYICDKIGSEKFKPSELETLNQIKPLGVFQEEIKYYVLPGVYIKGFIDDRKEDYTLIRDYKTASKASKARYYKDEYYQLDLYANAVYKKTGVLPQAEVCIIERKGNCFGMVQRRDLLSVGQEIWYHPREISLERIKKVEAKVMVAIHDISTHYKHFLALNK